MFDPCRLNNRAVIDLSGPNAIQFLHDLTTGPVSRLSDGDACITLLLNARGRILFDLIVHRRANDLIMDCDRDRTDDLIQILKMYRLRREVEISMADHQSVMVSVHPPDTKDLNGNYFIDPRHEKIGCRWYADDPDSPTSDPLEYHANRLSIGVAEGAGEIRIERDAAMECNFDQLGAIDWEKGCYMGQELTASMYHRSLLKKRLVPVTGNGDMHIVGPKKIYDQEGGVIGDLRHMINGQGVAMIKIDAIRHNQSFKLEKADGDQIINVHIRPWLNIEHKARQ